MGRGASCGISFDNEDFAFGRIAFLAVGQLARQRSTVQRPLAAGKLARPARGLAGGGGFHHLAHHHLGLGGMLLEPGAQFIDQRALHHRTHFGRD